MDANSISEAAGKVFDWASSVMNTFTSFIQHNTSRVNRDALITQGGQKATSAINQQYTAIYIIAGIIVIMIFVSSFRKK